MRLPINGATTVLVLVLAPVTGFAAHAESTAGSPSDPRRDPPSLQGMREPAALKGSETNGKGCCIGDDNTVQQPRRDGQSKLPGTVILGPATGLAAHRESTVGRPSDSGKACCPGEDHTVQQPRRGDQSTTYADNQNDDVAPLATTGLGQSIPVAEDISQHPMWRVYAFERDGIRYFQVNDLADQVQLVVGVIGDTFWALPAGHGKVTFSAVDQAPLGHPTMNWAEVYRNPGFSLNVDGTGEDAIWFVEKASY